jgi:hypothetical protein
MKNTVRFNIFFLCIIFFLLINLQIIPAKTIVEPDSVESPIRNYFKQQKILWTFDDYFIPSDYPPHKGFAGLSEKIISYGGHVNIMTILFQGGETEDIRNYSVIDELGWSKEGINKSLNFFSKENIHPACHGWDARSEVLNNASLLQAYLLINHTLWNWKNNFDIEPHFFLGASTSGNYNITLALKKFSETYWLIYGENFRWDQPELFQLSNRDAPAVLYIGKEPYVTMFDPLFGLYWGTPCETLEDAQTLFTTQSKGKEIIFIRGHPSSLNDSDAQSYLKLWFDWIDWIYQNHTLININHTKAIQYIVDRDAFIIEQIRPDFFIIDLTQCQYDHNVVFSQPYQEESHNWSLVYNDSVIDFFYEDTIISLDHGNKYQLITDEHIQFDRNYNQGKKIEEMIPGFELGILTISLLFFNIFIRKTKKEL